LEFNMSKKDYGLFHEMRRALLDYNVKIVSFPDFRLSSRQQPDLWDYLNWPGPSKLVKSSALLDLTTSVAPRLAFPVRYQFEVCLSHGYLNEYNIPRDFVEKLGEADAGRAQDLLEYVANQGKRIFDPMTLFGMNIISGVQARASIPHYCAFIRSATVTPTTILFDTPTVETSNRVIRQYVEHADRFLRVRFAEEKPGVYIQSAAVKGHVLTPIRGKFIQPTKTP